MAAGNQARVFELLRDSRISVVVPVFNEAPRILESLELLVAHVAPNFKSYEIIVVSDGSTDETAAVVRKFADPHVKLVALPYNHGKGHAVRTGLSMATGDYLFFIDGDMELHPRELRVFLALMAIYDVDVVVGSKRHPQSRVRYPWYRKGLSFLFQQAVRGLFDVNVTDTQVGLKLFRRDTIQAILPELEVDRYGFDLEMLVLARKHGFGRIMEAPVTLDYFSRQARSTPGDLFHVLRLSRVIIGDTWKVHRRVNRGR